MSRRLVAALGAALLLPLIAAEASPASPAHAASYAVAAGAITGRVLPLGDTSWRGERAEVIVQGLDGGQWVQVSSDSVTGDGRYRVEGLPAGTYRVFARPSFGSSAQGAYDGANDDGRAVDIVVPAGGVVTDIDVAIDLGATVTGRVTDERGCPVARVGIGRRSFAGGGPSVTSGYAVSTRADGVFVMRGLSAGVHRFFFFPSGDTYVDRVWPGLPVEAESRAVDVVVTANDVVTGVDGVLPVGGVISGRLSAPAEHPAAYAYALVHRWDGAVWREVEARPVTEGRFVVGGLLTGPHRLCFGPAPGAVPVSCVGGVGVDAATTLPVTAGSVTRRDHVGGRLASLRGSVALEDPDETPGFPTELFVEVLRSTPRGFEVVGGARVDQYGDYRIDDLAAGSYRVRFVHGYTHEYWPEAGSAEEAADVRLAPGASVDLDAVLDVGARISGHFLDDDADGARDSPAAYRRTSDGRWVRVPTGQVPVPGGYQLTGLRPGTYRIGFAAEPQWFARSVPVFWPGAPDLAGAEDIVVRSLDDRLGGYDIDVDHGSVLTGAVRGFGRAIYSAGDVVAYRRTPTGWVEERRDRGTWRLDGRYSLAGLPAGTYRVAFDDDHDFWAPAFHGAGTPRRFADAADVVLAADELVDQVDLTLVGQVRAVRSGRVAGRTTIGSTLRLDPGTWSPTATRLTFQWYAGTRRVAGATGRTYRLRPRDAGQRLSVVVTGSRGAGWDPLTVRTPATAPVRRG